MRTYDIKQTENGTGPSGLPNHWAIAPIYRNAESGETWCAKEEVKCVPPALGKKRVASLAWQKIGEIEQTDPRSAPRGPVWKDKEKRKPEGPTTKAKAA